jgi:hypothetical protein
MTVHLPPLRSRGWAGLRYVNLPKVERREDAAIEETKVLRTMVCARMPAVAIATAGAVFLGGCVP